jgi:hypothetical protein
MKKTILVVSILILFAEINSSQGSIPGWEWTTVRDIVQGIRTTAAIIDTATAIKGINLPVGFQKDITLPDTGLYTGIAIQVTSGIGEWDKFLVIWLKWDTTWERAIEMQYNSVDKGEIIIRPYAFTHITLNSTADKLCKIVYDHTTGPRIMTVYSYDPTVVNWTQRSIGIATEANGYVTVYFTAHTDLNVGGTATSDAYLFGAKISTTDPYPCTAMQGVRDIGDPYDFTWHGVANGLINAGLFNSTGYIANGQLGGYYAGDGITYPLASDIVAGNLPTSAQVEAVSISFAGSGDPSWL